MKRSSNQMDFEAQNDHRTQLEMCLKRMPEMGHRSKSYEIMMAD